MSPGKQGAAADVRELTNTHVLLKRALAAARPEDRPPPPHHLGGARPVCPALGQVILGMECARLFAHRVPIDDRHLHRAIMDHLEQLVRDPALAARQTYGPQAHLRGYAVEDPYATGGARPELGVVRRVAAAGVALVADQPGLVSRSIAVAVRRSVEFLTADPRPMQVRAFLEMLDARIVHLAANASIEAITGDPSGSRRPSRVLFRGADARGKAGPLLVLLVDGRYGLLAKLGARWSWIEGARDEVLACVPDAYFEAATRAVFASPHQRG